jgi:hypothetical protein
MTDDEVCDSIVQSRFVGTNRFYTPANKIRANVLEYIYKEKSCFHTIVDIRGDALEKVWQNTLFRKGALTGSGVNKLVSHISVPTETIDDLKDSPESVNVHTSHIMSPFFDIPFNENQVLRLSLAFNKDEIKDAAAFFLQMQDESYNFTAQTICIPEEEIWEWDFVPVRAGDKLRLFITSEEIYAIKLPVALTLSSNDFSIDFIKYKLLKDDMAVVTANNAKLQRQCDIMLASRWRRLGQKLGIVKKIPGLEE